MIHLLLQLMLTISCDWLGLDDLSNDDLSVYPNPTNGELFVTFSDAIEVSRVDVLDMNGKVVSEQRVVAVGSNTVTLDLGTASNGVYLVKISTGDYILHKRIVKQVRSFNSFRGIYSK